MRISAVEGGQTTELRRAVLRPSWPVGSIMHGDENPDALHLAAIHDGIVVGACVLLPAAYPAHPDRARTWQLRGMATAADRRGQGIGAQVLTAAEREVAQRAGRLIWCQAREMAISFYARHGFTGEGELFVQPETGIVHQLMFRELSGVVSSSN